MRIYVGNLNYRTDEQSLRELFEQHGQVDEVAVITDRETGQSRGFAFVTMATDEDGRPLTLREYREAAERSYILGRLRETGWNISKAAVKLGVERTNLHKKIRGYGLEREDG